ncbi:MAG: hypothetical protein ACYST9_06015, partial [Planctomycetota bacterium]
MTEVAELKQRSALSGWPMILGWAAMLIFTFHACTRMVAAGDTWVAMACGRHFINHGVDTVEPFSANSHDAGPTAKEIKTWPKWAQSITETVGLDTVKYWHPTGWVNQNWLTHVVFYWLTHLSPFADADTYSYNTLVYLKFAIYIITTVCVFYTCRQLKVNAALAAAFSCFAIFVGRSYLDIRPAGFSNVMVAILLFLFVLATYKNILYIWLIVPIAVLWCNLHGGYLYLFIMLVPFVGLNFLTSFFPNRFVTVGRKGLYHAIGAGITALLAMIVFNPFHLTNLTHTFIISLSKHAEMWRTINEWRPAFSWTNPVGTGFSFLVLFILSIGTLILWLFSKLLMPRLLKAPKNELERQQKTYNILTMIFTYVAAVFAGWVVFISFSFLKLDATSFIFCLLFVIILLLAVLKNVHFIYLAIALSMAALWSAVSMKGYAGRYIYPFVIIPCYVTADILSSVIAEKSKRKWLDIVFVSATAIASVVLVVWIIDPFKFKLPFWNMEQLWNIRRLIRPAYEKNVSVNYRYLFKVLYIVNGASLAFWLSFPYLRKLFSMRPAQTSQPLSETNYKLPKIDLALIAIASLTVYMALRSRRFIPIAGVAACPVVAMFIDQMIRTISASRNFHKEKRLVVSSMSCGVRRFFIVLGVFAVVGFGSWWGLKFKRIYIDACMSGGELTSVFMRMTASHEKPFYAGNFIRENKLAGKMFNAWTEGGFIALSQEPDPETGRTPLQLFMDGRAQAA